MKELWQKLLINLLWRSTKFRVMTIWREPAAGAEELQDSDPIKAVHFAESERSMNNSMRSHVESLDKWVADEEWSN